MTGGLSVSVPMRNFYKVMMSTEIVLSQLSEERLHEQRQQPSANTGRRRWAVGPGPGRGPRRGGPPGPHGRMMPVENQEFSQNLFRLLHIQTAPCALTLCILACGTVFGPEIMGKHNGVV